MFWILFFNYAILNNYIYDAYALYFIQSLNYIHTLIHIHIYIYIYSILLNHIVGKARLEIEIREFSASTVYIYIYIIIFLFKFDKTYLRNKLEYLINYFKNKFLL